MKFFKSVYFNVSLAILASVLIIMQEFWMGNLLPFINNFAIGAAAGIGFSLIAEVAKIVFVNEEGGRKFNAKEAVIGSCAGIIAAFLISLALA